MSSKRPVPIPNPQNWIERILNRVSQNEGGSYGSVAESRDDKGLSYGIMQWQQASGDLGKLLAEMNERDGEAFLYIFGSGNPANVQALLSATATATKTPWTRLVQGYKLWDPFWVSKFIAAGQHGPFQEAQLNRAVLGPHMTRALEIADQLGPMSERAMAIFFDMVNQHGEGGAQAIADWTAAHADMTSEAAVLKALVTRSYEVFRRATPPDNLVTPTGNVWRPVGNEWHLYSGGKNDPRMDLVTMIKNRRVPMLTEPGLRDDPVDFRLLTSQEPLV